MSGKTPLAKAIRHTLNRLKKAPSYLNYSFLEMDNNTAEGAVCSGTLGRKKVSLWEKLATIIYTLIETCKLNKFNLKAWLARMLVQTQDRQAKRVKELLPWIYSAIIH